MVRFPGEEEEDFDNLMDFVRNRRFDRMGAFAYSEEEDTYAARHYTDNVPEEVKQRRLDTLMALQQDISAELSEELVGKRLRLLVDEREGDYALCRSEWDSPEVDLTFHVRCGAQPGEFIEATVTRAEEFDLFAETGPIQDDYTDNNI